jgi:Tfp pilus assembly protein PilN
MNKVLGVDLDERRIRVVELERQGSPFNKFKSDFKVTNSFSLEFASHDSLQTEADGLKKIFQEKRIRTKYAVSSIQSIGVKSLITALPSTVTNIDEWIREHCERLLKIPVSPRDISFAYEILSKDNSSISVEITFVKNSNISEFKTFFKNAGLELIGLGAGIRDAQNVLWGNNFFLKAEKPTFAYCTENKIFLTTFHDGKGLQKQSVALESRDIASALLGEEVSSIIGTDKVILAGESLEGLEPNGYEVLRPFGLQSEYTLASGLALKGFLPELNPVNFLEKTEQAQIEERVYASLFKRVVLACGATTIFLLLAQGLLSSYLQGRIESLDNEILAMGPAYTEVAALERRVSDLKKETEENRTLSRRTNIARALHEIAQATPDGVWLNRLTLTRTENQTYDLSISGSSKESDRIAEYLKRLDANHLCSNVVLLRSGSSQESRGQLSVRKVSSSMVTFEIKAVMND